MADEVERTKFAEADWRGLMFAAVALVLAARFSDRIIGNLAPWYMYVGYGLAGGAAAASITCAYLDWRKSTRVRRPT